METGNFLSNETNKNHRVSDVLKGSIADKAGIKAGDEILRINGEPIIDIFDYRYGILDCNLNILVKRNDKEILIVIKKDDETEDIGLSFDSGIMDEYRRCKNNCIFCFIDQMPPGMRKTLYFKDDDSRLSFLQGNYVTLTNLSDQDVDRIIRFRMEPINISFQTTNPELRCKMLNNRFAGRSLDIAKKFFDAKITMNGQIVLCKGVNDKDELRRSIKDLMEYLPVLESVSVVPVGLTKYRDNLYPLEPFTKEDACEVIDIIESFQHECYEKHNLHFIHASDEWYLTAERELPEEDRYDGYLQLENGVGMLRLLIDEFNNAFDGFKPGLIKKLFLRNKATIVTGKLAYPVINELANKVMDRFPNVKLDVLPIKNEFFGELITVSGLLTGQDIVKQLKEHGYNKKVYLPQNVLKADEAIFLDDMTLEEFEKTLQVKAMIIKSSGREMLMSMLGL